jgi:hypothetical protein
MSLKIITQSAAVAVTATEVAGMDGNRTHPGRLSSAPQTVLKTAGLPSRAVRYRALQFGRSHPWSAIVRRRPLKSAGLAVILAVIGRGRGWMPDFSIPTGEPLSVTGALEAEIETGP